jgi:hypothetical protein
MGIGVEALAKSVSFAIDEKVYAKVRSAFYSRKELMGVNTWSSIACIDKLIRQ